MRHQILQSGVLCFVVLLAGHLALAVVAAQNSETIVGKRTPNFVLVDSTGQERALTDYQDKKAVAIVFLGTGCPVGNRFVPDLNSLQAKYESRGLQVLGINPNHGDTLDEIAEHAREYGVSFPVLRDPVQQVANLLGASRTPEAFLLDGRGIVRYHGRISDRFGYDHSRGEATRNDLEIAVEELLGGQEVSVKVTETAGCLINRARAQQPTVAVTYAKHVSRIMQEKCQTCHHPGTAAPFSLLTYQDAVDWAAMTREVVTNRRMPPWHADQRYGSFSNDRRLTDEELATLVRWIDDGTPLGDEKDMPEPKEFADGWTIGTPDVVFELPTEVTVPAQGEIPYRYYETETKFEEDVWISAAEARPGNRAVVHHIIVMYKAPGDTSRRIEDQWVAATAPGDMPLVLPKGVGRKIPAGSTLVWQMHYTPTGKEEKDRSQLGLVFYKGDKAPEREAYTHGIANHGFRIPAGHPHYRVKSSMTVPRDALILSFMPHMHLRGKSFEFTATLPDGTTKTLLSVPRYDFSWQSTYRLSEPLPLPKGTKIECVAHFDNSADNPANPDPTQEVRWGDQTCEEMMIGYVDYMWDDQVHTASAAEAVSNSDQR